MTQHRTRCCAFTIFILNIITGSCCLYRVDDEVLSAKRAALATILMEWNVASGCQALAAMCFDIAATAICGFEDPRLLPARLPAAVYTALRMRGFVASLDDWPDAFHRTLFVLIRSDLAPRELAEGLLPGIIWLCCRMRQHAATAHDELAMAEQTLCDMFGKLSDDPAAAAVLRAAGLWQDTVILTLRLSRMLVPLCA